MARCSPFIVVAIFCCVLAVAAAASAQGFYSMEITPEIKQRVEQCVTRTQEKWGVSGFDAYLTNVYHRRNKYDYRYVEVWLRVRGTDEGRFTFEKCVHKTFTNVTGPQWWERPEPALSFFAGEPDTVDPRGPKRK